MAAQRTRRRTAKDVSGPQRGKSKGVRASEKSEKYRFAQNIGEAGTAAEREYEAYALEGIDDPRGDPDVLLDVPVVKVDSIHLKVDDLNARVALKAQVLDLVKLNAGVDVYLGKLQIDIKGVEAQALLKVRLDRVAAIVDRVLTTIDRNPELVKSLGRTTEQIGSGAGHALSESGEAVEEVGEGAEGAVQEVGEGAGQAVGEVGQGAGEAVGDVGEGAGEAVGNLEQTVEGVGQTAGQAVDQAGNVVDEAGNVVGKAGQAAGGLLGGGGEGNGGGGAGLAGAGASDIAKLAAKAVAEELRASAKEEAKEIGLAAARKARQVGKRRKQRRAEELNATDAAVKTAEELEVDLEEIEGSGREGRITIRDVRRIEDAKKA